MPTINETLLKRYTVGAAIYYGCTKPAAWTPPALTTGVPAGGTDFGFTDGAATFLYKPTITGSMVEQVYGPIGPHMTTEALTLTFDCMESTYGNLLQAIQQGTGSTGGGTNLITVGGLTAVTDQCVVLVAKHADEAKYNVMTIYRAVSMNGVALPFKRGAERKFQVQFTAIPDTTRPDGDNLGSFFDGV